MRLTSSLLVATLLLAGCTGPSMDRAEFERLQSKEDAFARLVIATASEALTAVPPEDGVLGHGFVGRCKGRDGGIFYNIDANLTYKDITNDEAAHRIAAAFEKLAISVDVRNENPPFTVIRGKTRNGLSVDLIAQGRGTEELSGQSLTVSSECIEVGVKVAEVIRGQFGTREIRAEG